MSVVMNVWWSVGMFVVYRPLLKIVFFSCRCCMFVSCAHPVAVLNVAFCITCSLLMMVEDARGDHIEESYPRASFMTALLVAMSVACCLPHHIGECFYYLEMFVCVY